MSEKRVLFKYKFPDTYNPVYANGAQGGLTPQGELCLNFFLERQALPQKETYPASESGELGAVVEREPTDEGVDAVFVRYVSTGVVMSIDTARRVAELIQRQLKTFDELKAGAATTPKAH